MTNTDAFIFVSQVKRIVVSKRKRKCYTRSSNSSLYASLYLSLSLFDCAAGQYHTARPYIPVKGIPNFDPTQLPYWDIYQREGTADKIKVGGTMAGEFTAGLSGGQRKLLLFELVRQRVAAQTDLLICLDEPFAGVTDDFVPYMVERLNEMRQKHNIVLVTNDHVHVLKDLADNTLTVSAIDRSMVVINDNHKVDRSKALLALSVGQRFQYENSMADLKFFFDVEVKSNAALIGLGGFVIFLFGMMLVTFWNSSVTSASLIVIAGEILAYFSLNPYLLSAVDWRNYMKEESEALMHSSIYVNMILRTCLTLAFGIIIWNIEYGVINAVVDDLNTFDVWLGVILDNFSTTFPFIFMGIFTTANTQDVEMIGSLPFLLMLFMSTAYSPGSGIPVLKGLRYVFTKFYFWCYLPGVSDDMEGCPDTRAATLTYMTLASFFWVFIFMVVQCVYFIKGKKEATKRDKSAAALLDDDFAELQVVLYGERGREYFERLLKRAETFGNGSTHKTVSATNE
eukprot:scaffold10157_cov162-Amphora_coffeaeformis.AAC.4